MWVRSLNAKIYVRAVATGRGFIRPGLFRVRCWGMACHVASIMFHRTAAPVGHRWRHVPTQRIIKKYACALASALAVYDFQLSVSIMYLNIFDAIQQDKHVLHGIVGFWGFLNVPPQMDGGDARRYTHIRTLDVHWMCV